MRFVGTTRRAWILLAGVALGCNSGPDPTSPPRDAADLAALLVGDAAAHLGSDGKFILAALGPENQPAVLASDATVYAELAARQFGPLLAGDLEAQHGAPIDFRVLRACGRPLFARSAFAELPSTLSRSAAYYLGSFWIIGVCGSAGQRQISVAIAADASDIKVTRGLLDPPPNAVKMVGVPPSWDAAIPASAEAAAVLAARETGVQVAKVPVLVAPDPLKAFPQGAYWVVGLDRAVILRGDRSNVTRETPVVFVASAEVPANSMRRGPIGLYHQLPGGRRTLTFTDFGSANGETVTLDVAAGAALDLEKVTRPTGGQ